MRFAYADPPYIGQARKHYGPDAREVNHPLLIAYLMEFDGWALSLSSPSLHTILPMCPPGVRVGAWVKPFASFKPGVNPGYTWEPVIFYGGRKRGREMPTLRDFVSCNITLRKGLAGAKPGAVCDWICRWLNIQPGDYVEDVFPGTGIFGEIASLFAAALSPATTLHRELLV
jgi:hypothetical protein